MEKFKLGRTNLFLSKIGFGGIPIQRLSDAEAVALIRHGFDSGINWIDTANAYGTSEERFGNALQNYNRSDISIFSKAQGKDPETFRQQCEFSFRKLQVDYIDLYQFHFVPNFKVWRMMKQNGTVDYLLHLKAKGKVRHIGASAHTRRAALFLLEQPEIEVIQFPFNFLMINETDEILEKCKKEKKGFIAMKPFGGGILKKASQCIKFIMDYPVVTDPGFEKPEEIDEVISIASSRAVLTVEEKKEFEECIKKLGADYCRRCGYCLPCPQDIKIPILMSLESQIARFTPEKLREAKRLHSMIDVLKDCTGCRQCEARCPYELSIVNKMKSVVIKFNNYRN